MVAEKLSRDRAHVLVQPFQVRRHHYSIADDARPIDAAR
jgi:hypothetical protein